MRLPQTPQLNPFPPNSISFYIHSVLNLIHPISDSTHLNFFIPQHHINKLTNGSLIREIPRRSWYYRREQIKSQDLSAVTKPLDTALYRHN